MFTFSHGWPAQQLFKPCIAYLIANSLSPLWTCCYFCSCIFGLHGAGTWSTRQQRVRNLDMCSISQCGACVTFLGGPASPRSNDGEILWTALKCTESGILQQLSSIAEVGDCGHNRHGPKREGVLCPFRGEGSWVPV